MWCCPGCPSLNSYCLIEAHKAAANIHLQKLTFFQYFGLKFQVWQPELVRLYNCGHSEMNTCYVLHLRLFPQFSCPVIKLACMWRISTPTFLLQALSRDQLRKTISLHMPGGQTQGDTRDPVSSSDFESWLHLWSQPSVVVINEKTSFTFLFVCWPVDSDNLIVTLSRNLWSLLHRAIVVLLGEDFAGLDWRTGWLADE